MCDKSRHDELALVAGELKSIENEMADESKDIQPLSERYEKCISTISKRLKSLLAWPDNTAADSHLFFDGAFDKTRFGRGKDCFHTMGFRELVTTYAVTKTRFSSEIRVTFLVPNDLQPMENAKIRWYFHGGGLCTGAGDFIPWYCAASLKHARENKAIIIAPDYPLGPESNYEDILAAINKFLEWYKHDKGDQSSKEEFQHWTEWLMRKTDIARIDPMKAPILIEGDSAGAHVAFNTMFLNADKNLSVGLPVKLLFLRSAMVKHYSRVFSADRTVRFMDKELTEAQVLAHAQEIEQEIWLLEKHNLVPHCSYRNPPSGMVFAVTLALTGAWTTMFKRKHGPYCDETPPVTGNPDRPRIVWPSDDSEANWDCIERAENSKDRVDARQLVPIFAHHGVHDRYCPIENVENLFDTLKKRYPVTCNDSTMKLFKVAQLSGKEKPEGMQRPVSEVDHAFDYDIDAKFESWLRESSLAMDKLWMVGNS